MPVPDFSPGEVLTAAAMDSIGLWLVKTQTVGTAVPSVTVSGAFSSTYDNYRIIYAGGTASANGELWLTLGSTNTGYYNTVIYGGWSDTPTSTATGDAAAAQFSVAGASDPDGCFLDLEIRNPNLARRTTISGPFIGMDTDRVGGYTTGFVTNTTQYTAFTITPSTGTLTGGVVRVYGYRN